MIEREKKGRKADIKRGLERKNREGERQKSCINTRTQCANIAQTYHLSTLGAKTLKIINNGDIHTYIHIKRNEADLIFTFI